MKLFRTISDVNVVTELCKTKLFFIFLITIVLLKKRREKFVLMKVYSLTKKTQTINHDK